MKLAIVVSACLVVLASFATASTVDDAKKDIIAIDAAVVNLQHHSQVQSLNYFNGLAIKQAADELTAAIAKGAESVQQLQEKPTNKDAKLMISTLYKTEGKVRVVVDQMVKLKSQFEKLGVLGMASLSVANFQKETKSFAAQLVRLDPAQEQTTAQALALKFNADLDRCNAAYNGNGQAASTAGADRQTAPVSGGRRPFGSNEINGANSSGNAARDTPSVSKTSSKLARRSRLDDENEEDC